MTTRNELLELLKVLSEADPDKYPVVSLDEYFSENEEEDSIAPNNWGYGRPSIKVIYTRFKEIKNRPDVQGVYVGMHDEWPDAFDDGLWPAAENIHIISSASEAELEKWVEGLGHDGVGLGWPYGEHKLSPKPQDGYFVYTVYWD